MEARQKIYSQKRNTNVKGGRKKTRLIKFINENVHKYILGDLSVLDEIQNKEFTCAIPTAMLIFSTLDFMGYLLRKSGKKSDTYLNLKELFCNKQYFSREYKENWEVLVKTYRHGMMHQFYPTNESDISYGVHKYDNETKLFFKNTKDGRKSISLNVSVFSKDFKHFIRNLKRDISKTHEDSKLLDTMENVIIGNFNMNNMGPQNFVITSSNNIIKEKR